MPYCPDCQAEYVKNVEVCPDCEVTLVDKLPEEDEIEVNWVPLHSLPGSLYAGMVKEVLDREGIPSYIKSDTISTVLSTGGAGIAGQSARIYVPEEHFESAERLLSDMLDHI